MVQTLARDKLLPIILLALSLATGLVALGLPFLVAASDAQATETAVLGANQLAPLAGILIVVALGAMLLEMQGQSISSATVAILGILVAATAALRFLETAIPGPGGFSPIFAPIILAGYVFGARFGFLMGAMTLAVSAVITAGAGPWLPYQMFAAGWVGLTAGLLPHPTDKRVELAMLVAVGFGWGLLYGVVLNLYSWPFLAGGAGLSWTPEAGATAAISRYAAYYLATSLAWDLARALGNVVLVAVLGIPMIGALSRFRDRLAHHVVRF